MAVVSGIYVIECIPTGERYVGSSEDIDRRWSTHRSQLKRQIHHSKLLQARWNEFGAAAFRFEIVQIVEPDQLISVERHYLISGEFVCNAAFPMKNPMKGRRHTPLSLALMRKNRTGIPGPLRKGEKRPKEFGEAVSRAKKGRPRKSGPLSPEAAAKASARLRAIGNDHWIGRKHTDETRTKMKAVAARRAPDHYRRGQEHGSFGKPAWNRGLPAPRGDAAYAAKKVEIEGVVYPSLIAAAGALGICYSTLQKRRQRGVLRVVEITT